MTFPFPFFSAGGVFVVGFSGLWELANTDDLEYTPGTTGDQDEWLISCWFKKATDGASQYIFSATNSGATAAFGFSINASNKIVVTQGADFLVSTATVTGTDWHHILVSGRTAEVTAANRARVWLDGSEITAWDTDNRSSITGANYFNIHAQFKHGWGALVRDGTTTLLYFDGNLAECFCADAASIQGGDYTISDFIDAGSPVNLAGLSVGSTDGAASRLDFSNAASPGEDQSGNGHDWTNDGVSQSTDVPA